jgi:leader peptidase (prepilin peptidase)/N-methyltransferase
MVALAFALGLSASDAWARGPEFHWSLSPEDRARLILLRVFAATYIFALGAVLGSFLNVVIYRMPRGMNIVRPRSRCPACATPLALKDNIPVLSWLLLRGKCRICGGPISARYPLVEAAVGSLFLLLAWLEVRLGGINLPNWTPTPLDELTILSWHLPWGNVLMAAFHAWLLVTLLVMTLIQHDGHRIPLGIVKLALAVGLLLPLAWPWLRPIPALVATDLTWWRGGVDGLAGAVAGLALGSLLAAFVRPNAGQPANRWSVVAAMLLAGVFLGWQAAVTIGMASLIAQLAIRALAIAWPRLHNLPPILWPALATGLHVPLWKIVSQLPLIELLYR